MNADSDNNIQKLLSIFNIFVILLIPTIGVNRTLRYNEITETSLMWPWMILVRLEPVSRFHTDMYQFLFVPWTLLVFAPFLFGLRYAYNLYQGDEERVKVSSKIVLTAILQIVMIWVVYASQDPRVAEDRRILFIPQLLIILVQGIFTTKWFYTETKSVLTTPHKQSNDTSDE